MSTLADLLGHDNAAWMADPGRNCRPRSNKPLDIRLFADLFFPSERNERNAVKLCDGCPVRDACLTWALEQTDLDRQIVTKGAGRLGRFTITEETAA